MKRWLAAILLCILASAALAEDAAPAEGGSKSRAFERAAVAQDLFESGRTSRDILSAAGYGSYLYPEEGLAAVQSLDTGLWGFIDRTGAEVIPPQLDDVRSFSEGLAAARDRETRLWGYVDRTGAWAIAPAYDDAYDMSYGLAEVRVDGKYGYIDATGALVIGAEYDDADDFNRRGLAAVTVYDEYEGVIDRTGRLLLKRDYEGYDITVSESDGIVRVEDYKGGTTELYDLSSGEAKRVTALTASVELEDYMPFAGKKVAVLDGAPTLAHRASEDDPLPRLDGATALFPVYAAFVQALYPSQTTRYEAYDGDNDPLVTCTKTNVAYERLINGEADVIFVAGPSEAELAMAAEKGVEFDMIPFGKEAFVFVVNGQNPIEALLLNEIRWIYTGLIRDWSELGVEGLGEIIAYQRPENSGSQTAMEALMEGMPLMEPPEEWVAGFMDEILERVEYRNLPNALGYSFRFYCTEMMRSEVKLLAIDGVAPTVENIRNGSYPITSTLYAIRLKGNDNPNVTALLDWIQSDQGAELVEKTGYVSWTGGAGGQ